MVTCKVDYNLNNDIETMWMDMKNNLSAILEQGVPSTSGERQLTASNTTPKTPSDIFVELKHVKLQSVSYALSHVKALAASDATEQDPRHASRYHGGHCQS